MAKNWLCRLGIHKWGKTRSHYIFGSNIIDYEKYCQRCGLRKRWNKPKK